MPNITGTTKLAGLLGSPVKHSISPLMHNFSFQALGIDCVYLCFDVKENRLKEAVAGLRTLDVLGFNLTMPDKNKVLEYLDQLTPAARLMGAVNTVENRNGQLIGHNTDGVGFMHALKEQGVQAEGRNMTLLGIGGAATAICAQAALDGVAHIHVFARKTSPRLARMEKLAANLMKETSCHISIHEMGDDRTLQACLEESCVLVNATSVGMSPNTEACPIADSSLLYPELAVADIIYSPWETRLLSMAKERGCQAFNGFSMLIYQGAAAFSVWTGQDMPVDEVKSFIRSHISRK